MRPTPDEIARRVARLTEGLQRAGVKLTHQRLEVCREIVSAGQHPDVEAVYHGVRARVPTMSLDTVYRTLALLLELGLIEKLGACQERMRFDGNMAPHHHFVCTRCGEAQDFYHAAFDRLAAPAAVHALGRVQTVRVEVRGICAQCARRATA